MRTITLAEIFSEDQIKQISDLYNQLGDTPILHKQLLSMFNKMSPPLKEKGLLPEYAAYLIPFLIAQHEQALAAQSAARN